MNRFREIKRQEKALGESEARAILKAGEYGVLSTIGEDGYPYGLPVNYCLEGSVLYFHSAMEGHKLENIAFNEKVSFCVVEQAEVMPKKFSTHFRSVVAFGKARVVNGEEKMAGILALVERFAPGQAKASQAYIHSSLDKTTVVAVDVEHMSGKSAPAKR